MFEFARHVLDTAEQEQVMRLIFVPAVSAAQNEKAPTWLELTRAKFEQEGRLRLFPFGIPHESLGGHFRTPARLAYYKGNRIVEEDIDDVGILELGGTWGKPDVDPTYRPMVHPGGILLDYPAASA